MVDFIKKKFIYTNLSILIFIAIILFAFDAGKVYVIMEIVNKCTAKIEISEFKKLVLIYALISFGAIGTGVFFRIYSGNAIEKFTFNLRCAMNKVLLRKPDDQENEEGKVLSKVLSDVTIISDLLTNNLITIIKAPIYSVGILIIMFSINYKLSLLILLVYLGIFKLTKLINSPVEKIAAERQGVVEENNLILNDIVYGISDIKAYNLQTVMSKRYSKSIDLFIKKCNESVFFSSINGPFIVVSQIVPYIIIYFIGAVISIKTGMMIGTLLGFGSFADKLMEQTIRIPDILYEFYGAKASWKRIKDFCLKDEQSMRIEQHEESYSAANTSEK